MNGKTKVAELTTQNVDWTTQINDIANNVATNVVNDKVPGMIVQRAPYFATSRVQKANTQDFQMTAPAPKSGFKFLCWFYFTTEGQVAEWNADLPSSRTCRLFYCAPQNFPGTHYIIGYALYVPTS